MRFSENRTIAWVVLAACVLVSVFGLGGMGLSRERNKVLTVYDRGADTSLSTRHSVDAYLDSAAENAKLMASEAALHMDASPALRDRLREGRAWLDARRRYRRNRRPQGVGKALLIGYALVCLGVHTAFDWLWETIEGRTQR